MTATHQSRSTQRPQRWLPLGPETWRIDLLRIVLRISAALGVIVYVPSVYFANESGMTSVVVLDTAAIAAILGLSYAVSLPARLRAICTCLVFYLLGAGLLIAIGAISQIYLFGFSVLATLLLSMRWGLATAALNAATMLAIGYLGRAAPEMVVPRWTFDYAGWTVITANFAMVNVSLVVAMGAVIAALETALARANDARDLLRIAGLTARLGGWRIDVARQHLVWSDEVCEIHGLPADRQPTVDEALAYYSPEWREIISGAVARCSREGTPFDLEAVIVTAKGTPLWVRAIGNPHCNDRGVVTHVHGSIQDITPQKLAEARHAKLEAQFLQAQKMETIGNFAGGVAHDFNNLMTVVLSYAELLAEELEPGDPMRVDLGEIRSAGLRATGLTRQLLAFSRRQVLQPKVVELGEIVAGMENMLRRLIGEDVELATSCAAQLGKVLVDPGQIEQVIMNLAVNARDAMPQGGMLTIETKAVALDEPFAAEHAGIHPGTHVMLAVSDTGTGIDKATQARMFEPFFTTKERGKGTGLGLATVFGIVQQSGGTIWVYSEPGKGTTFKLYFPVAEHAEPPRASVAPAARATLHGTETILLVEDEEAVRTLIRTILTKYGYNVLAAQNVGDAFLLCDQHPAKIDLLLTDVVMPRMSGRQLAERLSPIRPDMKVLYMSGYTDDAVVRHGVLEATLAFIQKPITPEPLARKIRAVLDASG